MIQSTTTDKSEAIGEGETFDEDKMDDNHSDQLSDEVDETNENDENDERKLAQVEDTSENLNIKGNNNSDDVTKSLAQKKRKRKNKKNKGWTDKPPKTWVYVTGLPLDVTEQEIIEHFSKTGILSLDPLNFQPKIKLYRDEAGKLKGDASICYAMQDSVPLAIQILDGGYIRPQYRISVSEAVFTQKEGNELALSMKKPKVSETALKIAKQAQKQALSWNDEDDSGISNGLKIVVIKHMFSLDEVNDNPNFWIELEEDLVSECSKIGSIEKITVFEYNPEGVVTIKFGTAFAAEECVKKMNGRYFAQKKLQCFYWDGVTDYTKFKPADEEQRLDSFGDWIEQQEVPEDLQLQIG